MGRALSISLVVTALNSCIGCMRAAPPLESHEVKSELLKVKKKRQVTKPVRKLNTKVKPKTGNLQTVDSIGFETPRIVKGGDESLNLQVTQGVKGKESHLVLSDANNTKKSSRFLVNEINETGLMKSTSFSVIKPLVKSQYSFIADSVRACYELCKL